jgi:hypothetical protein
VGHKSSTLTLPTVKGTQFWPHHLWPVLLVMTKQHLSGQDYNMFVSSRICRVSNLQGLKMSFLQGGPQVKDGGSGSFCQTSAPLLPCTNQVYNQRMSSLICDISDHQVKSQKPSHLTRISAVHLVPGCTTPKM